MASGKSTVAQALAERFPRSVHVRGDSFRRMIVNGQAPMNFELSEEAKSQLELRYGLAVHAAKRYFEAGFTVVYQDIILGQTLAEVAAKFEGYPLEVVVLAPDAEAVSRRETRRNKSGYRSRAEIDQFDRVLREGTPRLGRWVDSSGLTVAQTVEQIFQPAG